MEKFKNAFLGNMHPLSKNLVADLPLLLLLQDKGLLTDVQVESLEVVKENFPKAHKLLNILSRLEDSKFDVFCSVLNTVGQSAVVKIIRPDSEARSAESQHISELYSSCVPVEQLLLVGRSVRDKHKSELAEILEVDYGLPDVLHRHELLTLEECQGVTQHRETYRHHAQLRASHLIECVIDNQGKRNEDLLNTLNVDSFLDSLTETHQAHVVNYIRQDGKIDQSKVGDMCPLNEQLRMKLHPCPSITEMSDMNSRDPALQAMLTAMGVISIGQHNYIMAEVPRETSNERLLLIMKRRSLAHVKKFINCLIKTGHKDVVNKLNQPDVIVPIHTTIDLPTITNEDKRDRDGWFSIIFNWILGTPKNADLYPPVSDAITRLQNKGCDIKYVEASESITWYILCQTSASLESLRDMYISNELAQVLHDIFNSVCGDCRTILPLRVEWRADYDFSKSVSFETHDHFFSTDLCAYDGELLETAEKTV